jgi:hypothetical protein
MQAVGNSTELIAGHTSRRLRHQNPARQLHRPAGRDQSRASSGPRYALGSHPSLPADRADGADVSSSRQLSRTEDSAPARLRGRGDVPPGPAAHTRRPPSPQPTRANLRRWAAIRYRSDLTTGMVVRNPIVQIVVDRAKAGDRQ